MASLLHRIGSRVKRGTYGMVMAFARMDRTGARERRLQERLTTRLAGKRQQLRSLAWLSEDTDDLAMAIIAWRKVAKNLAKKSPRDSVRHLVRSAHHEIDLRRRIEAGNPTLPRILAHGPDLPTSGASDKDRPLTPYMVQTRHDFLTRFWREDVPAMSKDDQDVLRKIYGEQATGWIGAGRYGDGMLALEPLLATWPQDQHGYRLLYKAALEQVFNGNAETGKLLLDRWWSVFDSHRENLSDDTLDLVWNQSEKFARRLITRARPADAEAIILPAFRRWPENHNALLILAQAAELHGDWATAAAHWQLLAAITNPVTTKTQTHVAQNPEEMLRKSKYAQNELRMTRFKLAHEMYSKGRKREFGELVCRAVETIPDQRVFKKERLIVDAVALYVQNALKEDGIKVTSMLGEDGKPLKIAICLDVLKLSDVHTHSRVVFAMCRNLMRLDPRIETHIIVTNERFGVTTPIVNSSFNPIGEEAVQDAARAALPEYFGSRFFLHSFKSIGLEGIIDTCKGIIDINPDVLLYGGGHRGLFSNESRIVRHCLYDRFASAFFYIQANNEVDDKLDMIIARGPHEIIGENGHDKVKVRAQPYPTIVDDVIPEVFQPEKQKNKIIVSAITGVRMDVKMKEQSDSDMKAFFSILDKNPGAVWHFIGSSDPEALVASNSHISQRVKTGQVVVHPVLPFDEFTSFVGTKASLFLHLPGFTGGSGGATVARRAGVPILTFKHSDVSGRQPQDTIFDLGDVGSYIALASRLLRSSKEWERIVRLQFAHTQWILETSGQGFYDCLTETVAIARGRMDPKVVRIATKKADSKPTLSVVKNTG